MFDRLCDEGPYSESDAARLIREVASALAFIHGIGIVHSDLKPENLMLSNKDTDKAVLKIVDFGCAHRLVDGQDNDGHLQHRAMGTAATPAYSPPEVLKFFREQKLKCQHNDDGDEECAHADIRPTFDMWSLGVIAYAMLVGVHPFDANGETSDEEMEDRILSGVKPVLNHSSPLTKHLSKDALEVLDGLIEWNPSDRLSADKLLEHPWVRGETASSKKIAGADKRLATYRKHEANVMRTFFKGMLHHRETLHEDQQHGDHNQQVKANKSSARSSTKNVSLLETAFQNLDPNERGYSKF